MNNDFPVLKIKGIEKIYKVGSNIVNALNGVDLEIQKGEFVVIMGRSGSGKTTLLNILGGLDAPTAGKIFIDGEEATDYHMEPFASEYRRDKIGFVFQSFNLLHALTLEENVALPLILRGEKQYVIKEKTDNILKLLGLYKWRTHRSIELSGGQQQRVALARALITSPSILLADEPTGNLDSKTSEEILELIVQMKKQLNQSIVLVTHDPKVATFADRVIFFGDGQIENDIRNDFHRSRNERTSSIIKMFQETV